MFSGQEFIRYQVASCSSFAPVPDSANLGPLPAFPSPASPIQVVSGSASIFYYLDGRTSGLWGTPASRGADQAAQGAPSLALLHYSASGPALAWLPSVAPPAACDPLSHLATPASQPSTHHPQRA